MPSCMLANFDLCVICLCLTRVDSSSDGWMRTTHTHTLNASRGEFTRTLTHNVMNQVIECSLRGGGRREGMERGQEEVVAVGRSVPGRAAWRYTTGSPF